MTRIKGVDISVYQKGISFSALKQAGVKFAIIRAGYGEKKDYTMDKFVKDCKANGIDFGFYWYSYAMSVKQTEAEAEKCAAVLKGLSPTYPVFFDMEEKKQISGLNTDTRTKMAIAFCEKIKQAGFKPGIYANPSFMENYYDKQRLVDKYDIWLAHWTNSPDRPSRYNYGQTMWQWGVDRIGGYDVDGDICFCEYAKPAHTKKTVEQLADEVIAGKWGNGAERERKLTAAGYDYNAVQKLVNEKLYKKTVDEIANEVIRGEWGNGTERKERLTKAGYDYSEVQRKVNQLLK
ncbi:MAG: GH25 family lysozyme [Oscillospiraceae bacterium]